MSFKTLVIEDNQHKLSRILEFLKSLPHPLEITQCRSFNTACKALASENFDVVLADMSLPTFERSATESGGRFRPFGGREIGRRISRLGTNERVIFITQYESFNDRDTSLSLDELRRLLQAELGRNYLGLIFYDSSQSAWKDALAKLISKVSDENFDC